MRSSNKLGSNWGAIAFCEAIVHLGKTFFLSQLVNLDRDRSLQA
jgi:hypothetical protein